MAIEKWELMILDGRVPTDNAGGFAAGDVDGDGNMEILLAGDPGIFWYRPKTFQRGVASSSGKFHVGGTLEDVDGDGLLEFFVGEESRDKKNQWMLTWYKPHKNLDLPWERYVIDGCFEGGPHDIVFADIDDDGERELVAIACYSSTPGIFAFKRDADCKQPWKKYAISEGIFTEGLALGDLDGDGQLEIICGPDCYKAPPGGPLSGHWVRNTYAPNFREMCRTALIDITGNGRPDIVITDSEYLDGYLSWFENRLLEDSLNPWIEHRIENGLVYSHSLDVRYVEDSKSVAIFIAEMDRGGWNAPYNHDARLLRYISSDNGRTWSEEVIYRGEGTHQAFMADVDGDGRLEVIGKSDGYYWKNPKVQIWKNRDRLSLPVTFKHRLLDRDKPELSLELLTADIDGDGRQELICGSWWYGGPGWKRHAIPYIYQVTAAYDIDGDGKDELIGIKRHPDYPDNSWRGLHSGQLLWVKPIDPVNGVWEEHPIGGISGDWPHGCVVAPLLPGGRLALVVSYHNAITDGHPPEIFEIPEEPRTTPWPKRELTDVMYNEELITCDIDGDGKLDIAGCQYWFENLGNGAFKTHTVSDGIKGARVAAADINGDGRVDLVVGQEELDFDKRVVPFSNLVWFENPGDSGAAPWKAHIIDTVRCAHSLDAADIDGDGEVEVICAEHDPFWPYRNRCRLFVYKKADKEGTVWYRYLVDGRFEHHDGAKVLEVAPGRMAIASIGWTEHIYTHLWEIIKE